MLHHTLIITLAALLAPPTKSERDASELLAKLAQMESGGYGRCFNCYLDVMKDIVRTKNHLNVLISALDSSAKDYRSAAITTLLFMNEQESVQRLVTVAQRPNKTQGGLSAIRTLGGLGRRAVPALPQLRKIAKEHRNEQIRRAAKRSVADIEKSSKGGD